MVSTIQARLEACVPRVETPPRRGRLYSISLLDSEPFAATKYPNFEALEYQLQLGSFFLDESATKVGTLNTTRQSSALYGVA